MQKQIDRAKLASMDIQNTAGEELADAAGLQLDLQIPRELRAAHLIDTLKNPYFFRVGELSVKLEFADDAPPLQETLLAFLRRKKSGNV